MPALTPASRQRQASSAKFSGGTTKQAGHADEGAFAPLFLAAGDEMQHLHCFGEMCRINPARPDMLRGSRDAGVAGVEIEVARVDHVAGDKRTLEKMDIVEPVDKPGDVIEVGKQCIAVLAGLTVDHMDGGAGGAEMHLLAPGFEIVARVAAMEHEMTAGLGQGVFDQGPGGSTDGPRRSSWRRPR